MGIDTCGKIKGFVRHEDILNFIRDKWDKNASDSVSKHIICPISECTWEYKFNEHSEDNENYYSLYGFICFKYNDENRMLFYRYSNTNSYENLNFYSEHNLRDMVESETTHLSLGWYGSSVEIIKEIVTYFGGGWIDENDCDDEEYYPVEAKSETRYVDSSCTCDRNRTMRLIYKCHYDGNICNKEIPRVDNDGYVVRPELCQDNNWKVCMSCNRNMTMSGFCHGSLVIEN